MAFDIVGRRYFESGFAVVPLEGKAPSIKAWQELSNELPSEEQFSQWENNFKNNNIGLVCGKASGVIAFDFDYEGPDQERIESIISELLPLSPIKKRGKKKWTAFYKYSGQPSFSLNRSGQRMIDFLSDGKQTVLPPSIHPETNHPYVWITEDDLLNFPIIDLPIIPDSVLEKIKELSAFDFSKNEAFGTIGGRHDFICSYAWAIIEKVESLDDLAEKMLEYDSTRFKDKPYFSDRKYFRQSPKEAALSVAKRIEKTVIQSKKKQGIDWQIGKKIEDVRSYSIEDAIKDSKRFYFEKETEKGDVIEVPCYQQMAEYLIEKNVLKVSDNGIFIYQDNHWQPIGKIEFMSIISRLNKDDVKPGHVGNFEKVTLMRCFDKRFSSNFGEVDGLMNLKNCILDVKTGKTFSHSSKYLFRQIIDIQYDPNSQCPMWHSFLNDTFNGDKELIQLSQEIIGYILIGGNPFLHRAFVLVGDGRNGKSTFIDVFRMLLGKSTSSVGLKLLDKPFSAVNLDGKIANLVEETPSGEVNAEAFKSAVGGGILTVAHKGFDEYELRVKARFVFACNDLPIFDDKNVSLLDRLVILPFNNYLAEEKRDTFLVDKLKSELPGILNWSIEGAKRVFEKRELIKPAATIKAKEDFRSENDKTYSWFVENIKIEEPSETRFISSKELYEFYCDDISENNTHPLGADKFKKRFKKLVKDECSKKNYFFDAELRNINIASRPRGFNVVSYIGAARERIAMRKVRGY